MEDVTDKKPLLPSVSQYTVLRGLRHPGGVWPFWESSVGEEQTYSFGRFPHAKGPWCSSFRASLGGPARTDSLAQRREAELEGILARAQATTFTFQQREQKPGDERGLARRDA